MDHSPLWTSSGDFEKLQLRSEEHVELALAPSDGALLVDLKVERARAPGRSERPVVPVSGLLRAEVVQGCYVGGGVSV